MSTELSASLQLPTPHNKMVLSNVGTEQLSRWLGVCWRHKLCPTHSGLKQWIQQFTSSIRTTQRHFKGKHPKKLIQARNLQCCTLESLGVHATHMFQTWAERSLMLKARSVSFSDIVKSRRPIDFTIQRQERYWLSWWHTFWLITSRTHDHVVYVLTI